MLRSIGVIFMDRLLQCHETFPRVVKGGNRFCQPPARQIHEQTLELAERAPRLERLRWRLHRLKSSRALDKNKRAPEFAVTSDVVRFAISRRDDDERATRHVWRVGRFKLASDVRRDTHEILHHGSRFFENSLVDLLMNVTNARAALIVRGRIGFVDVSNLERLSVLDFAVNLELPRDFLKLFFLISHNVVIVLEEL